MPFVKHIGLLLACHALLFLHQQPRTMPINLPNELLCQIFMLNASDINQEEYKVTRRLAITQISSQVCREWRVLYSPPPPGSGIHWTP